MKSDNPPNEVICPQCGAKAEIRPCFACRKLKGVTPLFSSDRCTICNGKGFVIHCEPCARNMQLTQDAIRKADLKALKKNPFLPYYDPKFKKYRK